MRSRLMIVCLGLLAIAGRCNGGPTPTVNLPDVTPVTTLPVFASQQNEVEIADSMNDIDPAFVLGSIVNTKSGQVFGLNNYLSVSAKPTVTLQSETIFRNLIENAVAVQASYLDFVSAALSDSVRAELSVVKTSKASMKAEDVDKARLSTDLKKIPAAQRNELGVIIGYIDFVLTASLFRQTDTQAAASGYGAKIGGKWFNKAENTAAYHRVVAVWAPLPFILDELVTAEGDTDLTTAADRAIERGALKQLPRIPALQVRNYVNRLKRDM